MTGNKFAIDSKNDLSLGIVLTLLKNTLEDIRITGWIKGGNKFYLLCYLGEDVVEAEVDNETYMLSGQGITEISR